MAVVNRVIKKIISYTGYSLRKNSFVPENPESMSAGLKRLRSLKIIPNIVIDLGAAQGTWTEKAMLIWPEARYELVEPLMEQVATLDKLKSTNQNIFYHLAVAGETSGEANLNISSDLDGSGIYGQESENTRKVPVITIDDITGNINGDILIKFDTHGYEVPILKGATESLKRVSALIVEVYGFRISPTCLLFNELTDYVDQLGFRLFDIVDTMRRPGDQAFWQADAIYLKKSHPIFEKNSYA